MEREFLSICRESVWIVLATVNNVGAELQVSPHNFNTMRSILNASIKTVAVLRSQRGELDQQDSEKFLNVCQAIQNFVGQSKETIEEFMNDSPRFEENHLDQLNRIADDAVKGKIFHNSKISEEMEDGFELIRWQ